MSRIVKLKGISRGKYRLIGRILPLISLLIVLVVVALAASAPQAMFAAGCSEGPPIVDGLFYGIASGNTFPDATDECYELIGEDISINEDGDEFGGGNLYFYDDGTNAYVAMVLSTDTNDNVFADLNSAGQEATDAASYLDEVNWKFKQKHSAAQLIGSDNMEFQLSCAAGSTGEDGEGPFVFKQGLVWDDNGTWKSDTSDPSVGGGTTPTGYVSASSTAYNFNNSSWDFDGVLGATGNAVTWWSPFNDPDGTPTYTPNSEGWPTYSSTYDWEWSVVYEFSFTSGTTCIDPEILVASSHNSPSKTGDENTSVLTIDVVKSCPATFVGDPPTGTYEITVSNPHTYGGGGDDNYTALDGVTITDTLPNSVVPTGNYTYSTSPGTTNSNAGAGSCSASGNDVTCTFSGWAAPDAFDASGANDCPLSPARPCDPISGFQVYPGQIYSDQSWTVEIEVQAVNNNAGSFNTAVADADNALITEADYDDSCQQGTPATVAYFTASDGADSVSFDWSTGTEVGNLGFNIYAALPGQNVQLNDELIPSHAVDAMTRQDYTFETPVLSGALGYIIETVDVLGRTQSFGHFKAGEVYGQRFDPEDIDWQSVRDEHEAKAALRLDEARARAVEQSAAARASGSALNARDAKELSTAQGYERSGRGSSSAQPLEGFPSYDIQIDKTGIYRLTYSELKQAGLDLKNVSKDDIALTYRGDPVSLFVSSGPIFRPGDFIEFYAEAQENSLYTNTNVFQLVVDAASAQPVSILTQQPQDQNAAPDFYLDQLTIDENTTYLYYATSGDPWQNAGISKTKSFTFEGVDHYQPGSMLASLTVDIQGSKAKPHSLNIELNDTMIGQSSFDFEGITMASLSGTIPEGALQDGANTLTVNLLTKNDFVRYDKHTLTYPRAFVARDGILSFTSDGQEFVVEDLTANDAVVYRIDGDGLTQVTPVVTSPQQGPGFSAHFAGTGQEATYWVVSTDALLQPAGVVPSRAAADINSGPVDTLIISHPDFIDGLQPLVAMREAQGVTDIKVVDVEDVYAEYSYGMVDAQAIRDYLAVVQPDMVLLVGADTYDYLDYLGLGAMSFIPSLYAPTDSIILFAPVDPLFVDYDGDDVPNAAIGRLPVRNSADLQSIIAKTITYNAKPYGQTAVLANGPEFGFVGDAMASEIPSGWNVTSANATDIGVAAAREALLNSINAGVALTSYFGHSYEDQWLGLLNTNDVAQLTNVGKPTLVTQWGCFNTYYVTPYENTLAHEFLFAPDKGAAAVTGSTTYTTDRSESELANLMLPLLVTEDMTIGDAMQQAKERLPATDDNRDVMLGWTILGIPWLETD